MATTNVQWAVTEMTDSDHDVVVIVTERFERRLAEESGKLRVEMASEFGKVRAEMVAGFGALRAEFVTEGGKLRTEMADGFGRLRAEMIDRNAELLKWGLLFAVTQTAAIAGVVALLR